MSTEYLNGFNYFEYLKRHHMLGQVDPWRKTDEGKPIYTILVTLDAAITTCKEWSGQEFSKKEFTDYLKLNDTLVFNNVEDYNRTVVPRREAAKASKKRIYTEEERAKRRERMLKLNATKSQ